MSVRNRVPGQNRLLSANGNEMTYTHARMIAEFIYIHGYKNNAKIHTQCLQWCEAHYNYANINESCKCITVYDTSIINNYMLIKRLVRCSEKYWHTVWTKHYSVCQLIYAISYYYGIVVLILYHCFIKHNIIFLHNMKHIWLAFRWLALTCVHCIAGNRYVSTVFPFNILM